MRDVVIDYLIGMKRRHKSLFVMSVDYIILVIAFWVSLSLRDNNFFIPSETSFYLIILAPLIAIPIFYGFGLYQSLVRYSNYKSIITIIFAISIYTFFWFALVFSVEIVKKPYDFLIINWLVSISFVGGSRYIARYMLLPKSHETKKVIIYGAGSAGTQIYSALEYEPGITVVGFIDRDEELENKFIEGIKIFSPKSLEKIISEKNISEIYLAIPSSSKSEIAQVIESLKNFGVVIRKLPSIRDLASGKINISDLKKIKIQDLLRREQRSPNQKLLEKDTKDKNVLITGAGGSIGSEISNQILRLGPSKLVLFDISEASLYRAEQKLFQDSDDSRIVTIIGNVNNQKKLEKILELYQIDTVYHTAAYKHVPLVEKNISAGVTCNIFGTLSCIKASLRCNVKSFVFVSTDKAVRPTNFMGATKRFAEQILQSINESNFKIGNIHTRVSIVRFGNVLGSSGSVVPLFTKQIKNGGPLTVTDPDIIRYFMTPQEASQLVIQAGAMGKNGEIFLLDMGDPVKVFDLAKDMITLSGKSVMDSDNPDGDIEIKFTGLRPGEKLYEELLIDSQSESTKHERIFKANEKFLQWEDIENLLKELNLAVIEENNETIKEIFLKSVDGFKPELND